MNVNFANQCGNTFESGLLHCSQIGADIKTCQSLGKTVLLSLGGGVGDYGFSDAASATKFADTLWNKFGAGEDPERPFDDAVIDGFDFDIEHGSTTGYPELATALRSKFAKDSSKNYFLSAAPQCPYPDASLGDLLSKVPLDFAFIQFYNNYCSIDGQFNYDTWSKFADSAPNKNIKLFVGVPATSNIAGYVDTSKLSSAIEEIKCDSHFAGVSLWDASGAWLNTNDKGENFVVQVKNVLNQNACVAPTSSATTHLPPLLLLLLPLNLTRLSLHLPPPLLQSSTVTQQPNLQLELLLVPFSQLVLTKMLPPLVQVLTPNLPFQPSLMSKNCYHHYLMF